MKDGTTIGLLVGGAVLLLAISKQQRNMIPGGTIPGTNIPASLMPPILTPFFGGPQPAYGAQQSGGIFQNLFGPSRPAPPTYNYGAQNWQNYGQPAFPPNTTSPSPGGFQPGWGGGASPINYTPSSSAAASPASFQPSSSAASPAFSPATASV